MNNAKVAVITGASTGFGRLTAETLARAGYRVFATMRDAGGRNAQAAAELEALAARESLALYPLELDVTSEVSVEKAVGEVVARCGRIDVAINNAGYAVLDLAETVTTAQAQRLFDTNVFGVMRMNRAVLPAMRAQRSGLLIHISSGAGRLAIPAMSTYCASKFALEALAEVYRYELAGFGIDSVIVEPGACRTPIVQKFERGEDQDRAAGYGETATVPGKMSARIAGSTADPQEIADIILKIVETPYGERRLRYRAGVADFGVTALNAMTDEIQAKFIEACGL